MAALEPFLRAVNESFLHMDKDRQLLERSMEISNRELTEVNETIRSEGQMRKETIDKLKEALQSLHYLGIEGIDHAAENEKDLATLAELIKEQIERRKEAEKLLESQNEALRKVNAELDRFVYSASHDLKAPLVSVKGLLQMMREVDDAEDKEKILSMVERSISKMDSFIHDILDFAYNARSESQLKEIDLAAMIDDIFEGLQHGEDEGNVQKYVTLDLDGAVFSDHRRLHIILSNLIFNAIRYGDPKKPVRYVRVSGKGGSGKPLILEIEDNGIGIADEHQVKIFNMFFRATNTKPGSGIGLYIVKETVMRLGGNVRLVSKLGAGSTFYLEFPQ